ncbi:hypothetical protein FACS1894202_08360 [Clostridia bacterium]|nr:hypothetical protein FACS1894202_08360 [Clostridia bacterium]
MTHEERVKLHRDFKKYAAIQELLNNWEQIRAHAQYTEPEYRPDRQLTDCSL